MIFVNAETNSKIHIGRAGEHKITTVVFDVSEWVEEVRNEIDPDLGTIQLIVEQNSMSYPQLVEYNREEKKVYWVVTHSNTSEPGIGKCELFYFGEEELTRLFKKPDNWETEYTEYYDKEGNKLVESAPHEWNNEWKSYSDDIPYFYMAKPTLKTALYEIIVTNALGYNEEEPPGPYESWVDDVLDAAADAKQVQTKAEDARDAAIKAQGLAEEARDGAIDAKENSQAWATGKVTTEEGTRDVTSDEPQFNNNSKYYSEVSSDFAKESKSYAIGGTDLKHGELDDDIDNSKYYSIQSESWAVGETGKRDGEKTNNAKYFAEKADESATLSKSYAVGGTDINHGELDDDEDNAKHYSELSKSYAVGGMNLEHDGIDDDFDNAKYYATEAKASERAASSSATNAAASERAASSSATNASTNATNAAMSATNAAASERAASSSANNAAISADKAEKYGKNPPKPNSETKTWWVYDPDNTEDKKDKEGYIDTNAPYSFHFDYIVENQTKLAEITGMKIGDMAGIQAAVSDPMNAQLYIYTGNGSINGWEFLLDLSGATGNGISSISKTSSAPNEQGNIVDTYTITYTLSDPTTFTVTNGKDGADGTGSGDMIKKDYDPDGVVKTAGGIVKYVESQVQESGTEVVWKKWTSTNIT